MSNHSWENVYFEKNSQWEPPHFSIKQKNHTFPQNIRKQFLFSQEWFDIECI